MDLLELRLADLEELAAAATRLVTASVAPSDARARELEAIADLLTSRVVSLVRTGTFAELRTASSTLAQLNTAASLLRETSVRAANRVEQLLPVLTAAMAPDTVGALPMVLHSVGPRCSELLAILSETPFIPTPRASLRRRLSMDEGNLSRMLGQLEHAGIIERIGDGRRAIGVMLTPTGRSAVGCDLNADDPGLDAWLSAMIDCGYITLVPNDLAINPVITDPGDPDLGTNVTFDSKAWSTALADGRTDAYQLLVQAARLLVAALPSDIAPTVFVPWTEGQLGQPAGPHESLPFEINYQPLLRQLAEACNMVAAERTRSRAPSADPRRVTVLLQDVGPVRTRPQHIRAALLGFERSSINVQSLSPGSSSEAFRALLRKKANERVLGAARSKSFARLKTGRRTSTTARHGAGGHTAIGSDTAPNAALSDVVVAAARLADGLRASGAVLEGVFVQPTPAVDDRWINIERLSSYLREKNLLGDVHLTLTWVTNALMKHNRSSAMVVYNTCDRQTHTADKRFDGLDGWSPARATVRSAWFGEKWTFTKAKPAADVCIVSCVSNNWGTYQQLALALGAPDRRVGFVSLLGPTQPVAHAFLEDGESADLQFLPILVWNPDLKVFQPGPNTTRFGSSWTTLARAMH